MLLSITACVLAILVPLGVAIVSHIYVRSVQSQWEAKLSERCSSVTSAFQTSLAQLETRVAGLAMDVKHATPTHLASELAAVAADLEAHAKSCRKQFGRIFAEMHHEGLLGRAADKQSDLAPASSAQLDADLEALLRHQSAEPVKPSNGSA